VRKQLLYSPLLLTERLGAWAASKRRLRRLRATPAEHLTVGHVDSLELLDLVHTLGVHVIYDIGANVGTWTLLARAVIPDACIEAFEPLVQHHELFRRNVDSLDAVTLHPVAIGSCNQAAIMHVTEFSDASSMLPLARASRLEFGVNEVENLELQLRGLDDYQAEARLRPPDLIKIDVQGYELEVLKGAARCLESAKAIIAEVSFIEYYEGQCLFHEIVGFLERYGFTVAAFGVNTVTGRLIKQTDVLFTKDRR
jgi:FkbM family methyltransferase